MAKKKDERQYKIRQIIAEKERIRLSELASIFEVSNETIRKDIRELEDQNVVDHRNGYVFLKELPHELPVQLRSQEHFDEKKAIMIEACKYIKDRMFVYLDAGSTCQAGIPLLQNKKQITVVTNSILIAYKCCLNNIHTIVLGGHISDSGYRSYGPFPCQTMDRLHIDVALIGSQGIKDSDGFTSRESDYSIKRHVLQQSEKIIVVADAYKFNEQPNYRFAKFQEADIFITNKLTKEQYNQVSCIKKIIQTS